MQRRFLLSGLLAALTLSAAACTDETPTLTGDDQFPPGSVPVTREVILPASQFFRLLNGFSGYSDASDAPYVVVANQYDEGLNAHALTRFTGFPLAVAYRRDGQEKRDTAFRYVDSRLVLRVDTTASTREPVTVQVWQAAQSWDRSSATWTTAVDTGSVETPWAEPGGTRGALLAEGVYARTANGDSLVLTLAAAAVTALADTLSPGVVITTSTAGSRVELFDILLRAAVKPDSASPDTTIFQTVETAGQRTTVFTPDQPGAPAGTLAVGGIRGARALIELDPDQPVPGCAAGETCGTVPLRDVDLNQVALLLRPVPRGAVPGGFDPLNPVPLALRLVEEPELGAAAPLGQLALDGNPDRAFNQIFIYTPGDSLVALPITGLSNTLARNDTVSQTFALVSELEETFAPPTFGVALFEAEPRLRIVYTLPARRRLP